MTTCVAFRFLLSLLKGEGWVRVESVICSPYQTPHLDPLPSMKGRGTGFDFGHACFDL